MKRTLRSSLRSSNKQLKKQSDTSIPPPQSPPQTPETENKNFFDTSTAGTTLNSETDTVTEGYNDYDLEKTNETNKQAKYIEKDLASVNERGKVNKEKDKAVIVSDNKMVKNKDIINVDESKLLLQGIIVETEDKSLSISLDTERKCFSLTVKSNVHKVKILPKLKTKLVRLIINHQGRSINHTNYHNPYLILLKDGLNHIEILAKELESSVDDREFGTFNGDWRFEDKYSLFITKL
ncbi:342_t:CDS:2 [Funneliformis geosporum]|uniref:19113_t:CDS:1 n=1 Tax=Funneliformis geosporum TaxID=1117311 RepID=A0A9W4STK5_9GLOM|nr:342_t:CDS:2 [Funneliformis geosporum]CAI2180408.1 19113_t:CDS:2 [Funneliformis geosporum]